MNPPCLVFTLSTALGLCQTSPPGPRAAAAGTRPWDPQAPYEGWIDYPSSDGLLVHAYLFKPDGRGPFKLFVYTPGGGNGAQILTQVMTIHRLGRFDAFLKSGYVVLAPAYRGALDFGPRYQAAFDYGGREVDDVAWGARYLIDSGLADPAHVCFSGVSHGAKISMMVAERYRIATAVAPICGDYDISSAVAGLHVPGYCAALSPPKRVQVMRDSILKDHPNLSAPEILAEARRRDPLLHVDRVECPVFVSTAEHDFVVGHYVAARMKEELVKHNKRFIDKMYRGPDTTHNLPNLPGAAAGELWKDLLAFCEDRVVAGTGTIPLEALKPDYPQPQPEPGRRSGRPAPAPMK